MEAHTHVETSKDKRKRTKEVDRLMNDAIENVGAPTSQLRKIWSLDRYVGYMALMSESVETDPSLFQKEVHQRG